MDNGEADIMRRKQLKQLTPEERKTMKKEAIPLSPEQLDVLVKGRKIVEVFVSENTLFIKLDDGSQIEHKVSLTSKKDKQRHIIHVLSHTIDEKKSKELKKYDHMYG
jgi:hypothetical protein